jgi:AraC family ethanolamine operon transcriptional activator
MAESRPSPILLNRSFDDFDELSNEVRNWDLDLRQLDGGRFEGELLQAVVGQILFTEARFGRTLEQKGSAPPGLRTIAIPASQDVRFNWRKKTITGNDMLIFPRHGDWESFSQPDFHVFIMSLPECLLQEITEAVGLRGASELLDAETVSCSPTKMASLREKLRGLILFARENDSCLADAKVLHQLEYDLPTLFVDAILGSRSHAAGVTSRQRDLAIVRAGSFISENADEPLTVRDVCQAADVSERTLQYAFMEHVGIRPKAYLKAVRLNGVRRELKNAQRGALINQVAMRWGFWHMSQFAADYRNHFGELPSETVRRVVPDL